MTADSQHQLLALQELDTSADQLSARLRALPERAAVAALESQEGDLGDAAVARAGARQKLADEQARLEADLADADARDGQLAARLRTMVVPREAEAVMAEQRALAARRSELEDLVLERMQQIADLDDEDSAGRVVTDELGAKLAAARDASAVAERDLSAQLADLGARRAALVPALADGLLRRYEDLRRSHGGVAVARLEAGRCLGCHLTLSTKELDRIRHEPADALVECEHCGRLLVR